MEYLRQILHRKPRLLLVISVVYLCIIMILKWWVAPTWARVWFLGGGLLGVYLLDIVESFVALSPSPFRSVIFLALYLVVSFFVVSSGGSEFGSGMVLAVYIQLLLWQIGQWRLQGNLSSWYHMVAGPVAVSVQRSMLILFGVLLLLESYIFIRA